MRTHNCSEKRGKTPGFRKKCSVVCKWSVKSEAATRGGSIGLLNVSYGSRTQGEEPEVQATVGLPHLDVSRRCRPDYQFWYLLLGVVTLPG